MGVALRTRAARFWQNRVAVYALLIAVELLFMLINWLNAQFRAPTDGWELKIAAIDNHLTPVGYWLIPYTIGFFFAPLVPLWAMLHMPNKLFRQYVLAMMTAALLSYVIYITLPTYVTKPMPDQVPGQDVFARTLRHSYEVDADVSTHNAAPSQHVFYALINMCFIIRFRPRCRVFITWVMLAALITVSTVTTRRHNVPDLIAGYGVAVMMYYAGLWLGARLTAWLGDEHAPIQLPRFAAWMQRRIPSRAGID
jgi:hypothetical protein